MEDITAQSSVLFGEQNKQTGLIRNTKRKKNIPLNQFTYHSDEQGVLFSYVNGTTLKSQIAANDFMKSHAQITVTIRQLKRKDRVPRQKKD